MVGARNATRDSSDLAGEKIMVIDVVAEEGRWRIGRTGAVVDGGGGGVGVVEVGYCKLLKAKR